MSTTPPPPPPPEEYPSFGNGAPGGVEMPETLDQGRPNVASHPGRVIAVVGVVGVILLVLLYNVLYGGKHDKVEHTQNLDINHASLAPPPMPAPTPVFTPPPVPEPVRVPVLHEEDNSADLAALRARLHSSMIVSSEPGGGGLSDLLGGDNDIASDDANLKFQSAVVKANTKAARVNATFIGDLRRTIAQGRLIQATLESAINTDLPAPIRAIVSRDVYAEAGNTPLIPKGSRLIGQYSTTIMGGQTRVFVVWTRVIRPDGVDVMLGSPLVDQIGQAGIGGQVDTHFQDIFSRAVLGSVISIGFAIGADAITPGNNNTSTTASTFGTTQSGNAASSATVDALNRLGGVTQSFLTNFIDIRPTILVDQGAQVNVFVNRDLVFPSGLSGTRMIP